MSFFGSDFLFSSIGWAMLRVASAFDGCLIAIALKNELILDFLQYVFMSWEIWEYLVFH